MKRYGVLIVAAVSTLLAWQQESRFGNIGFRLPQGWRSMEQGGRLAIMPGDLPQGQELFILLMPGQELSGDFRAHFERWVQSTTPRDKSAEPGPARRLAGNGMDMLTQVVSLGSGDRREVRMFMGFNPGGRFESYVVVLNPGSLYQRYEPEISAFMASLTCYPASPAPSAGYAPPRLRESAPEPAAPSGYAAPGGWQSREPGPGALPSLPPLPPKPGRAIGRVVDAGGRPLENAEVSITQVFAEAGLVTWGRYSHGSFPVRGGRYEVELPAGAIRVTAYALIDYEGQSHRIELQPLDGQDARATLPSGPGIVRDFVLLTSGLRAGHQPDQWGTSNIGGALSIEPWSGRPYVHADVTLTPMGPMMDGSPGRVIRQSGQIVFQIKDIPLGKYHVSVTINGRPVAFELRDSDNTSYGRGPLVFQPDDAGTPGVKRVRLLVR